MADKLPDIHNIPPERIPRHVAVIVDGNGRWAKKRGMPRLFGHRAGMESLRTVTNADNVFLTADGWIQNLSAQQMHLFMDMEARVICDGRYAYEASVVCECNNGSALDTVLLPLGTARMIVYAEVPVQLQQAEQLAIELTAGGQTISFDLK